MALIFNYFLSYKFYSILFGRGDQLHSRHWLTIVFMLYFCHQELCKGEPNMAKDKDKGKEKGNKPKLSVKEKKLKKKEKRDKKTSMV